ncbi:MULTISPECIES: hypothetical protein [Alteromonas]|uniref:Uncharacterized protein n=1 Tax=Alteromonas pelagimontana TaxID=1858656 RepID=A0A6M4MDL6_9ALTE|nr:hypothetical protein [Alteromonas pelagimontana]NKX32791.1 hypothetical protein [Alteromonadaceae bacterium A_SAG1]QJR81202.1 hypothetical protein CA267_010635 [Alteromonas pelagimontana]
MNITSKASKEDVLHAFSAESNPNTDTLASYLKSYPQYREALIDLSIEIFTAPKFDEVAAEKLPGDKSRQAWSKFQSLLSPTDPASTTSRPIGNPLSNLSDERFRELASELNVNRLFLSRLRDCSIQVTTIPERFLSAVAQALTMPLEGLISALEAPPIVASGLKHKASGKPEAGDKITFEEALTSSALSEAQQAVLRDMKD